MSDTAAKQRTIAKPVELSGLGLFSGIPVRLCFRPAPPDHGVVFVRTDLGGAAIPALVSHVVKRPRRSALKAGEATVETTEHCLSAVAGLNIDNLIVEINGPELPGLDGSAQPYAQALLSGELTEQAAPQRVLVLDEPISVRHDDTYLAAIPCADPGVEVLYELDYSGQPAIGRQVYLYNACKQDYLREIAPARTFVLQEEARALQALGLGKHLTARDILVLDRDGPLDGNLWRFPDECVRHKILDLLGDLKLLGVPVQARLVAVKSGHALNQALVKELTKKLRRQAHKARMLDRGVMDVRELAGILPHRYPMLLVDRVLELDADRRALGVKNVTINEPFLLGHFPGTPIMPGVLIVEAMAQLSGMLVGQSDAHKGKLAVLLSLDRVKLRRPVVPGDQLVLEAESARIRSTVAHMRCRAYVGQEIVAEAEIKFMMVDPQQI